MGQSEDQLYAGLLSKQGTKLKIFRTRDRRVKLFNSERMDEENYSSDVCIGQ